MNHEFLFIRQLIETENLASKRQKEYELSISKKPISPTKSDKWMKECHDLIRQLDIEINKREDFKRRYEETRLKNKEFQSEVSDLKLLLHQTQTGTLYEIIFIL